MEKKDDRQGRKKDALILSSFDWNERKLWQDGEGKAVRAARQALRHVQKGRHADESGGGNG